MSEESKQSKEEVQANLRKLEAETKKIEAETRQALAEAAKAEAEVREAELDAWSCERAVQKKLASDEENHLYRFDGEVSKSSVNRCMAKLTEWSRDTHRVWCQGPSFDFPIVDSLYRQYDRQIPWKFWNQRDARTVTGLLAEDIKSKINFNAHDAAEDCVAQAKCVQYVYNKLGVCHTV